MKLSGTRGSIQEAIRPQFCDQIKGWRPGRKPLHIKRGPVLALLESRETLTVNSLSRELDMPPQTRYDAAAWILRDLEQQGYVLSYVEGRSRVYMKRSIGKLIDALDYVARGIYKNPANEVAR